MEDLVLHLRSMYRHGRFEPQPEDLRLQVLHFQSRSRCPSQPGVAPASALWHDCRVGLSRDQPGLQLVGSSRARVYRVVHV